MLQIRTSQQEVFRRSALERFVAEMVLHAQDFSSKLCAVIGAEQVEVVVRRALDQGEKYGWSNRGPLRLYVEMTFLYGGAFDTDPQYPWAGEILRQSSDQMERAARLYDRVLAYQKNVSGPGGMNTRRALTGLQVLIRQKPDFTAIGYPTEVRRELSRIFPEKLAYLGEPALTHLLEESSREARLLRFPPGEGDALLTVLKFAFGHGCTDDLLYPWIARTLQDERIVSPEARAERLQQKATTWLDHVLTNSLESTPT